MEFCNIGDSVEYLSSSSGKWISATVSDMSIDGRFQVACKPGAWIAQENLPHKLRLPTVATAVERLEAMRRSMSTPKGGSSSADRGAKNARTNNVSLVRQPNFEPNFEPAPLTLESLSELLDNKLKPIQSSVDMVRSDLDGFKATVEAKLNENNGRINTIETDLLKTNETVSSLQHEFTGFRSSQSASMPLGSASPLTADPSLKTKIDDLERQIHNMKISRHGAVVAVVGNLLGFESEAAAKEWMWKELKDLGGPKPLEIYPKGDFKMMLFMRFASKAQCDTATSLLNNARRLREGKTVWARPEPPIEQRVAESFLFGCKKMFLDRDYNKKVTFVDTDTLSLSIDRQLVLKVSVSQKKLNAGWQGS